MAKKKTTKFKIEDKKLKEIRSREKLQKEKIKLISKAIKQKEKSAMKSFLKDTTNTNINPKGDTTALRSALKSKQREARSIEKQKEKRKKQINRGLARQEALAKLEKNIGKVGKTRLRRVRLKTQRPIVEIKQVKVEPERSRFFKKELIKTRGSFLK